jgi:hypothetical protein
LNMIHIIHECVPSVLFIRKKEEGGKCNTEVHTQLQR